MPCICSPSEIQKSLSRWFKLNGRQLPWRETNDPYAIWLSEVILQQTRVDQGMSYYLRFLDRYPDIFALAAADEEEVLHLWQGLGYYSRGRNLLKTARRVVEQFDGCMPRDYKQICSLPGIGAYTASAILSFAYNLPHACVDGNIYRVLSRLGAIDLPIDSTEGKKIFQEEANALLDKENPGLHNQAIMELGALVCTPRMPRCTECPVISCCAAYKLGIHAELPVKRAKPEVKHRYLTFFFVRLLSSDGNCTLIHKRPGGDVWQGLYELPLVETEQAASEDELYRRVRELLPFAGNDALLTGPLFSLKHALTHQQLHILFYSLELSADQYTDDAETAFKKIRIEELDQYPFPKPINLFFESDLYFL